MVCLESKKLLQLPFLKQNINTVLGYIHDQCYRITEYHLSEIKLVEKRISERYSIVESPVSVCLWSHKKDEQPPSETGARSTENWVLCMKDGFQNKKNRLVKTGGKAACYWHAIFWMVYIKQRWSASFQSIPPSLIIEESHLQTFFKPSNIQLLLV